MAKQTVLEEVKMRMQEMKEKKAGELDAIRQKQAEAQTQKEAAELAIKDATERMDLEAYEEAKQAKHRAQTAIDMYSGRYKQIAAQEYISETESDKVIDSLLEFQKETESRFKADLAEYLRKLAQMAAEYQTTVDGIEQTIVAWTRDIHTNYNSRGTTIYKETGTDRSPYPIPVRQTPYRGCSEAIMLENYLEKAAPLFRE